MLATNQLYNAIEEFVIDKFADLLLFYFAFTDALSDLSSFLAKNQKIRTATGE
jgi:hypothetical protein